MGDLCKMLTGRRITCLETRKRVKIKSQVYCSFLAHLIRKTAIFDSPNFLKCFALDHKTNKEPILHFFSHRQLSEIFLRFGGMEEGWRFGGME